MSGAAWCLWSQDRLLPTRSSRSTEAAYYLYMPDHILDCLGLLREDLFSSPLLILDFLRVNGLLGLV
ncbi:hypothetical protein TNCV_1665101 [Trichonephila clavipes]|uniref:Uncharacterized protein n=1 Tax=Trichonephila clavipes TaxID=2585209 RepID=A0A8X6S1T8_TRICX|nr:hypothetical protein TNCV_1665101 [Trichonephila clavipes]